MPLFETFKSFNITADKWVVWVFFSFEMILKYFNYDVPKKDKQGVGFVKCLLWARHAGARTAWDTYKIYSITTALNRYLFLLITFILIGSEYNNGIILVGVIDIIWKIVWKKCILTTFI